jgi:acetyl esterase/lipase
VRTILPTYDHLTLATGADIKGVWIEPVPELVTGNLQSWAGIASVKPVRIPGYWSHKKGSTIPVGAPPMPGEKVVLILHGGGYIRLSAHPSDMIASIPRGLLQYCDSVHRVLSVEYRLSVGPPKPAHPFPAALLDALAGYNYLVKVVGFDPADIIIEGDSAGGNLTLALTRYLVEYKDNTNVSLPSPPSAILLVSPWVDLGTSHHTPSGSAYAFVTSDILNGPGNKDIAYSIKSFVGPHGLGAAEFNRYISPGSKNPAMSISFKGFPRTFIIAGGAETLYDQIKTLKEKMVKDLGEKSAESVNGKVTWYEAKDAVHDYLGFDWHEPERGETFRAIAEWLSET